MERLTEGMVVKHFKWELLSEEEKRLNKYCYKIISMDAMHTETNERMVVYQSIAQDGGTSNRVFVRPYEMFMGKVDKTKYPDIKQVYRLEELK